MSAKNDPAAAQAQSEFEAGFALHQKGRLAQAREFYERALAIQPTHPDALHLLGVIAYQAGDLSRAVDLIGRSIEVDPGNAAAFCNRGAALKSQGRVNEALECYDRAIQLKQDYAEAHNNRGVALQALQRLEEALESYDRAVKLNRNFAEAFNNRGLALLELKRADAALESFGRALKVKPDYAEAHCNRGVAQRVLKRLDAALESIDRALKIKPGFADACNERGIVLQGLGRLAEALESYDRALQLAPGNVEAHANRGVALQELKRYGEALESLDRALKLRPAYPEAFSNRGVVLHDLNRLDEALDSFERALALKPAYAEAHNNRGNVLQDLMRPEEALASYDRALAFEPDYAEAHWNAALCRLLVGDYARGWEENEWRWKSAQIQKQIGAKREFRQPLWLGAEPLQGKSILLYGEQGLGDTLQFCRYAKLVGDLGARVILEVPVALAGLMKGLAGVAQVVEKGCALPSFDYHCPLMSLPLAFKTTLENIPAPARYLSSDPAKVAEWEARLGKRTKPRIGLTWSGSATQRNDHNRSMALSHLAGRLPPEFQYLSLQKDVRAADKATLESHPEIRHFEEQLNDFSDTAALCELMDMVVTVDTSTAHLAGAMGKPVWILLCFGADWRYLRNREDNPWYPSARLFRQKKMGDWSDPVARVRKELLRHPFAPA